MPSDAADVQPAENARLQALHERAMQMLGDGVRNSADPIRDAKALEQAMFDAIETEQDRHGGVNAQMPPALDAFYAIIQLVGKRRERLELAAARVAAPHRVSGDASAWVARAAMEVRDANAVRRAMHFWGTGVAREDAGRAMRAFVAWQAELPRNHRASYQPLMATPADAKASVVADALDAMRLELLVADGFDPTDATRKAVRHARADLSVRLVEALPEMRAVFRTPVGAWAIDRQTRAPVDADAYVDMQHELVVGTTRATFGVIAALGARVSVHLVVPRPRFWSLDTADRTALAGAIAASSHPDTQVLAHCLVRPARHRRLGAVSDVAMAHVVGPYTATALRTALAAGVAAKFDRDVVFVPTAHAPDGAGSRLALVPVDDALGYALRDLFRWFEDHVEALASAQRAKHGQWYDHMVRNGAAVRALCRAWGAAARDSMIASQASHADALAVDPLGADDAPLYLQLHREATGVTAVVAPRGEGLHVTASADAHSVFLHGGAGIFVIRDAVRARRPRRAAAALVGRGDALLVRFPTYDMDQVFEFREVSGPRNTAHVPMRNEPNLRIDAVDWRCERVRSWMRGRVRAAVSDVERDHPLLSHVARRGAWAPIDDADAATDTAGVGTYLARGGKDLNACGAGVIAVVGNDQEHLWEAMVMRKRYPDSPHVVHTVLPGSVLRERPFRTAHLSAAGEMMRLLSNTGIDESIEAATSARKGLAKYANWVLRYAFLVAAALDARGDEPAGAVFWQWWGHSDSAAAQLDAVRRLHRALEALRVAGDRAVSVAAADPVFD